MIISGDFPSGATAKERGNVVRQTTSKGGKSMSNHRPGWFPWRKPTKPMQALQTLGHLWSTGLSATHKGFWEAPPGGIEHYMRDQLSGTEVHYRWFLAANMARICLGLSPIRYPEEAGTTWPYLFGHAPLAPGAKVIRLKLWWNMVYPPAQFFEACVSIGPKNQTDFPSFIKLTDLVKKIEITGTYDPPAPDPPSTAPPAGRHQICTGHPKIEGRKPPVSRVPPIATRSVPGRGRPTW